MRKNFIILFLILAFAELSIYFLFDSDNNFIGISSNESTKKRDIYINTSINPIESKKSKYFFNTVCVDVSCITNQNVEIKHSLLFSESLKTQLLSEGFTIGSTNSNMQAESRALKASKYDVAITISCDGGFDYDTDTEFTNGITIYTNPSSDNNIQNLELAEYIHKSIEDSEDIAKLGRTIAPVSNTQSYPFLNHCKTACVNIVIGNIREEPELLEDEEYMKSLSSAVTKGIMTYFDDLEKLNNKADDTE